MIAAQEIAGLQLLAESRANLILSEVLRIRSA
jgi:hypothetical protein